MSNYQKVEKYWDFPGILRDLDLARGEVFAGETVAPDVADDEV